jgi:hypothetical protein
MDLTELQRCGSQALNVEQLESGDVIVDITPPTRVTQVRSSCPLWLSTAMVQQWAEIGGHKLSHIQSIYGWCG